MTKRTADFNFIAFMTIPIFLVCYAVRNFLDYLNYTEAHRGIDPNHVCSACGSHNEYVYKSVGTIYPLIMAAAVIFLSAAARLMYSEKGKKRAAICKIILAAEYIFTIAAFGSYTLMLGFLPRLPIYIADGCIAVIMVISFIITFLRKTPKESSAKEDKQ